MWHLSGNVMSPRIFGPDSCGGPPSKPHACLLAKPSPFNWYQILTCTSGILHCWEATGCQIIWHAFQNYYWNVSRGKCFRVRRKKMWCFRISLTPHSAMNWQGCIIRMVMVEILTFIYKRTFRSSQPSLWGKLCHWCSAVCVGSSTTQDFA